MLYDYYITIIIKSYFLVIDGAGGSEGEPAWINQFSTG